MTTADHNVVYLALGSTRVSAAAAHLTQLVDQGHQVLAVVADVPEWTGVDLPAAATVHRVPRDPRQAVHAARRIVLGQRGLLAGVDLLVAGDPEAVPVAYAARRRRRDLPVRFEPVVDEARRPAAADLAVVTPWYPSPADPLAGTFVRAAVAALGQRYDRVSVLHTEEWPTSSSSSAAPLVTVTLERLARLVDAAVVLDEPEAELTRMAVPLLARPREFVARADAHLDAVRAALPTGRIEAPVVHAHGGMFGGVVATALARPDARIVVIESSPLLAQMLAQPATRERYERVLERADEVVCTSPFLSEILGANFPAHLDKLRVVPKIVDFDILPARSTPPAQLRRWLHVGPLLQRRGLSVALEAFAEVAAADPQVTLTLVDAATTGHRVTDRIKELKLRDRVTFVPPVPHTAFADLLHGHDLLVHAGQPEGLGELLVEAVATGTPLLAAVEAPTEPMLAVLSEVAGTLVETAQDASGMVDGYRRLGAHLGSADVSAARAALQARYEAPAVLPQLTGEQVPDSAPVTAPARPGGPAAAGPEPAATATPATSAAERIVLVAINAPRFYPARDFALRAAAAGFGVDVITHDANLWREAARDHRLRVHPIDVAESRRPMLRVEQAIVYRVPGKVLSAVRKRTRRQESIWPELGVLNAQRAHRKLARLVHDSGFERGYRIVRPRIMWRVVRRDVLPKLDLTRTRRVVVAGTYGVTVGWQLARRHPDLVVTTSLHGFE
ncbi:glycosyltransferase [Micromonospora sp. CB01531]|uniref:glycosyltransferase n=1 Tax=Micromonospora sp. CB01531 TaxID=1718947 RepID=UPI00095E0B4E|nr:glycosyltransferase [Micromonospora sp. CB01531]OKI45214.1 hypothetical protein A6A27_12500 [Micromonospora sp. CB01531]